MMTKARAGARRGLWTAFTAIAISCAVALPMIHRAAAQEGEAPAEAAASDMIAGGSAAAGKAKSATCAACHGADGNSVTPDWPSLAGQHPAYIVHQLQAFAHGERQNAAMVGFASALSEQDMRDLAAFYSTQELIPKGADPALVSLGQDIYRGGIPERGIPACIACHGPTGHGNYLAGYPRISGQHASYMYTTMRDFAAGTRRSDTRYNQMMRNLSELLLEDEIRAVTSFAQGLSGIEPAEESPGS